MSGPSDWITPRAAVVEYNVPLEVLTLHMQAGHMTVRCSCGELMLHRPEVAALALAMKHDMEGEGL